MTGVGEMVEDTGVGQDLGGKRSLEGRAHGNDFINLDETSSPGDARL